MDSACSRDWLERKLAEQRKYASAAAWVAVRAPSDVEKDLMWRVEDCLTR